MKNRRVVILLLLLAFSSQVILLASENPFLSDKKRGDRAKSIQYPGFVQRVIQIITPIQRTLQRKLTKLTRDIKETRSKRALFFMLLIAFLFGVIHAFAPGHGKTIITSYFLSETGDVEKGIIAGCLIAFLQAASALILVLVIYFVIEKSHLTTFDELRTKIKLISYGLIALIGLFLFIKALLSIRRKRKTEAENIIDYKKNNKNVIPIAVAIGIVPCSGVVIILLFSIGMGVLKLGILLVIAMACGIATTISSLGIMAIFAKKTLLKFFSGRNKFSNAVQISMEIAGSLFILLLGAFLFTLNLL